VRKILFIFIIFLFFSTCFSMITSGIKIWPGKYNIDINRWPTEDEIVENPTIQVTNTDSYDINVSVRVDNPSTATLTKSYSLIPDLSWIRVDPEVLHIPAGSSEIIEIFIEVPENEQSSHYNEKWETLVVITPPIKIGDGINLQPEIAVKLFIETPVREFAQIQYIIILLFIFVTIIIVSISFYVKKKKRVKSRNKKF